jgi:transposase
MRFVPIKSDDQLDMQSLHRVRERWVMRRTAVINQIRGLLLERGISVRKGGAIWRQRYPRKRGNCYLRTLFVQRARAVLQFRDKQSSGLKAWLAQLTSRTHYNVAGVALANKLVRMAWAVLAGGDVYRPSVLAAASA